MASDPFDSIDLPPADDFLVCEDVVHQPMPVHRRIGRVFPVERHHGDPFRGGGEFDQAAHGFVGCASEDVQGFSHRVTT